MNVVGRCSYSKHVKWDKFPEFRMKMVNEGTIKRDQILLRYRTPTNSASVIASYLFTELAISCA